MPLFRFRLESPEHNQPDGSPHFREGTIEYDTKEGAREELERREVERAVIFQAPDIDRLVKAEGDHGFRNLSGRDRAALALHRQTKPYRLVKLEKVRGS